MYINKFWQLSKIKASEAKDRENDNQQIIIKIDVINSNQNIMWFWIKIRKTIEAFRTTPSLPLQLFLLTLLLQGSGACGVRHGGRVWSYAKAWNSWLSQLRLSLARISASWWTRDICKNPVCFLGKSLKTFTSRNVLLKRDWKKPLALISSRASSPVMELLFAKVSPF